MTQVNEIIVLSITPTLLLFFCRILTGGHYVGAIIYCIDIRIAKTNIWFIAWSSFQWNTHGPLPLLQEVHQLYLLLLRVMVAVARSLVCETIGCLVTHSGRSFADFLVVFPLDPVPFDLQSFWIWRLLPHLWQVTSDLTDEPPPELLIFTLWRLMDSTYFKDLLVDFSMAKVYAFGNEGLPWECFSSSWFPPLWTNKIAVFMRSLLYKGLINYELLLWYEIHVTHKSFFDRLFNILVLLNTPLTEYGDRSILKYASDVP